MLSFQLPLELMLLANLALSFVLVLPLPLSKPGVALCRFSTTKVGQGITAAAFTILLLLMIQPLYDMKNLHMQVSDSKLIRSIIRAFGRLTVRYLCILSMRTVTT